MYSHTFSKDNVLVHVMHGMTRLENGERVENNMTLEFRIRAHLFCVARYNEDVENVELEPVIGQADKYTQGIIIGVLQVIRGKYPHMKTLRFMHNIKKQTLADVGFIREMCAREDITEEERTKLVVENTMIGTAMRVFWTDMTFEGERNFVMDEDEIHTGYVFRLVPIPRSRPSMHQLVKSLFIKKVKA